MRAARDPLSPRGRPPTAPSIRDPQQYITQLERKMSSPEVKLRHVMNLTSFSATLIFDLWGSREREKASLYAECRTDVARMGRPAPLWGALSSLLSNERTNDLILAPVKPYALVLHADSRPAPCLTPNPSLIPGPARRGGGALPAARVPPF